MPTIAEPGTDSKEIKTSPEAPPIEKIPAQPAAQTAPLTSSRTANEPGNTWSSLEKTKLGLEVVKIVVSGLVTWAIFSFGHRYAQNDALTRQRVVLWGQISTNLNDIYCYYLCVGQWKDLSQSNIIDRKRALDKVVYSNLPFFSEQFFSNYTNFMGAAFSTNQRWAKDAKLRTAPIRPQDPSINTDDFTGEDNAAEIHNAYFDLLRAAAKELDTDFGATPAIPKMPTEQDLNPSSR